MKMELHTKWLVGMVGSAMVGVDPRLTLAAVILGMLVSILTVIHLIWDFFRKAREDREKK